MDTPAPLAPVSSRLPSSAHGRAQLAMLGLLLLGGLDAVGVWSGYSEIQLLTDLAVVDDLTPAMESRIDANDSRQALIGLTQTGLYFVTVIVYLVWWHRAYRNSAVIRGRELAYSPGWAVGYWFVPFFNLVRPYQIAKEMWDRSTPEHDRDTLLTAPFSSSSTLVGVWWAAWVASNIVGNIFFRQAISAETLEEITRQSWTAIYLDAGSIVAAILALLVVRGIDARQEFAHAELRKV